MTRKILLLAALVFGSFQLNASHLFGGEITWQCLKSGPNVGKYVFTLKVYRACEGIPFTPPTSITVYSTTAVAANYPSTWSIPLNAAVTTDISPPNCQYTCANPNPLGGNVQEFVQVSPPTTLSGIPPATGWVFEVDDCCRNSLVNQAGGGGGFTIRALMYPYNNTNTNPCFDSSPYFAEKPSTFICNGYQFTYNPNAIDPEYDELVYDWAWPLEQPSTTPPSPFAAATIPFSAPYSLTNQLPGNPTINQQNGEIRYTPGLSGNFATCIKATAYKCGIKVAEIFRDYGVTLTSNCTLSNTGVPNTPPDVNAPFQDPITGLYTLYKDTVCAGDTVSFFLNATDFEIGTSNIANNFNLQSVQFSASGSQFGAGFTNPNSGCLLPPCATTSPSLPTPYVQGGVGVGFLWPVKCVHAEGFDTLCVTPTQTYTFVIKAQDNYCPAPAIQVGTINITVKFPDKLLPPKIRCADVQNLNGDLKLSWSLPAPRDTHYTFTQYEVYGSLTGAVGSWHKLDSVFGNLQKYYQTETTISGTVLMDSLGQTAQTNPIYFQMFTRCGCDSDSLSVGSNIVRSMRPGLSNGAGGTQINWSPVHTPALASNWPFYEVWKEYPIGTWTRIATLPINTTTYTDASTLNLCNDTITYRIVAKDTIAPPNTCESWSAYNGIRIQNVLNSSINPAGPVTICAGTATTLTALPATGAVVYNYLWSANAGSANTQSVSVSTAGVYSVIVTQQTTGCKDTSYVTVNSNPLPTVAISGTTAICQGSNTNVTLTFTGTSPWNYSYTANGLPGGSGSTSTNPLNIAVTPSATTTYAITVISNAQCTGVPPAATAIVTVHPKPTAALSGTQTICAGASASLQFAFTGTGPWTPTYNVPGGGTVTLPATNSNPFNFNVTPASSFNYTVSAITDQFCTGTVSGSANVTVVPLPTATLSTTTPSLCAGQNGSLTITFTGQGPWTYSYKDLTTNITYGPNNSASNSTTVSVTPGSTTNYVLIGNVVGANNCSAAVNPAAVQIVVHPLPTANISGTTAICNGANANLPIALTGTGPFNITYVTIPASGPHNLNSAGNATSLAVNPTATTSYVVTTVQDAFCSRNNINDTVMVTVHPLPTATISTTTPNICQGTPGTLSVSFTGTGPWTTSIPGVGNINTSLNPYTVNVGPLGSSSYNLAPTVSDAHCTGNTAGTANINVVPTPTAAISGNNTICSGQSTNLTLNFTGQAPFIYNYWTGSGVPVSGNTGLNSITIPVTPPVGTTVYTLTGTFTGNGCSGNIGGSASIVVRPLPTSAITTSNDSICNGGNTNVLFNFTGTGPYSYTYSVNGTSQGSFNTAANSASVNVSPTSTTTYAITNVTDALCSNSTVHNTVVTVLPLPTAIITTTTPSLCLGQNGSIVVSFTGYGPFSTNYTTGGPNIPVNSSSNSISISVSPTVTTNYALIGNVTGLLGCSQAVSVTPAQIVVHPLPTASIANNSVICAGQQTSFNINFTGTAPFSYTYSATNGVAGGSGSTSNNPVTINVTPATSTTYSLGSVSDNFCTATVLNGAANVTVHPLPTAAITGTATICDGSQTNLSIAFTGTAPFNFTYSDGGLNVTNGTTNSNPYVFAVSPNTTTTYSVTAISDGHCTGNAPSQTAVVTVTPIPSAQIAGTTAICNGQSTSLNFTFTGQPPYSYSYKDQNNNTFGPFTSNSSSASISVSPTATTTYTLTGSVTGNGCSGNTSGSAIITVHPLPTATVANNSTICAGNQASFNITFTGTAPFNYTWSGTNGGGSGTASSNVNSVSIPVSPGQTSTYTVTAISDANCTGTVMNGSAIVTVNPLPTATLSATPSICNGQTANLNITFTGTGPFNYSYSATPGGPQGSFTSNTNTATVSVTPGISTGYTITAISDANCTAAVFPATANVVVHDLPTASISGTNAICIGQSSTLTFNFVGTAPFTYQYSNSSTTFPAVVSNNNSATLSVTPGATNTYSLVSISDAYCSGSVNGSAVITVNPLPTPAITGINAVCDGNSSVLTVNPSYSQYNWSSSQTTQNITVNQTNNYIVTVTDANGCINSTSFQFTVNQVPVVSFMNDTSLTCEIPNIHFTNTSTNIDPGATYLWNFGDTSSNVVSNLSNPSHTYQLPGNYPVSLTVTNPTGCSNTLVQSTPITFFPLPVARFKADPSFTSIFNSKISFTDLSAYAVTWHWDFGNGTVSDANNPNPLFYYDEIGDYQVTLTITNVAGCVDQTRETVSITPFYIPNAFTPNADGKNDLFFNPGYSLDVAAYTFRIWNRWGQKVFESQDYNSFWNGKDNGGKDAPQGTYVYSLDVKGRSGKDYNFNGTVTLVR